MNSFAYFLPGRSGASPALLDELGLTPLVGRACTYRQGQAGPGGESGVLVCASDVRSTPKVGDYDWRKCDGGAYWVGCHKRERPRPEDLATAHLHPGHPVQMGDGNV